jgi:HD-GYP domain-containing protein (c-di-GMP phosphodiesterase class II)
MKRIVDVNKETGFQLDTEARFYIHNLMINLKIHDVGTFEHCERVGSMCFELAQELELSFLEQAKAYYSGYLHDVGKIKISPEIINKPSKLDNAEFSLMKNHTLLGAELIDPLVHLPFFKDVREAVLNHHERVDGKGYNGLSSEKIPYTSKIILVADTVDAMGADRAYRKGLPMDVIVDELITCSGSQFEPHIVNVFLNSIAKKKAA